MILPNGSKIESSGQMLSFRKDKNRRNSDKKI